jgi:hypothetical protein
MRYDFSEQEVAVLRQLIDLAIKAGGIQVAEAGLTLFKKLGNPIREEPNDLKKKAP